MTEEIGGKPRLAPDKAESLNGAYDPQYLEQAYLAVPEIGKGRRWYDYPYNALQAVLLSNVGYRLPQPMRHWLSYARNYLIPWNDLERDRAWSRDDPQQNLFVPEAEHARIPGVWVAELFPPSEFGSLSRALARNKWDETRIQYGFGDANQEMLQQSRSGNGWAWWTLGAMVSDSAKLIAPDARQVKLPAEIDMIELVALQVGPSLTVVVAEFTLSEVGQTSVDRVWHATREPRLIRGEGRPRSQNRLWSGLSETQESRRRLHDLARDWMATNCPGSFAHSRAQQPLLDLVLLDLHDPSGSHRADRAFLEALRALGITSFTGHRMTADQLPGLLLEPVDKRLCPTMGTSSTWTLWGQTASLDLA